jgi:hypothetical protein
MFRDTLPARRSLKHVTIPKTLKNSKLVTITEQKITE